MDRWIAAVALLVVATAASAGRAQTGDELTAQRHYERGIELFDRGEHQTALESFHASFELQPSPSSALMMGRTLRELGRRADSARELENAARLARLSGEPRHVPTADAAERELGALARELGRVVVVVNGGAGTETVTVGERELRSEVLGLPVWVEPGRVEVVLRAADGHTASTTVSVRAGSEVRAAIDASGDAADGRAETDTGSATETETGTETELSARAREPAAGGGSVLPVLGWASLGLSAAGWAAFAVFGLLAKGQFDELDDDCGGGPCPPDRQADLDRGRTYETIANVGLGVGIGALVLGAALLLLAPSDEPDAAPVALVPGGMRLRFDL